MRERRSESERPKAPRRLSVTKTWLGHSPCTTCRIDASESGGTQVRSEAGSAIRERKNGVGEKSERAGRRCRVPQPAEGAIRAKGRGAARDVSPEAAKSARAEPSPFRSDQRCRASVTKSPE